MFPDFHLATLRRKPRSSQQKRLQEIKLLQSKRLEHLAGLLHGFLPDDALASPESGPGSRERIYTKANTFYGFLQQVWSADGSCQEAVHRIIEQAQDQGMKQIPSTSTSAYVQARKRLELEELRDLLYQGAGAMELNREKNSAGERPWIAVDGTGFSMPDTPANQAEWPQPTNQKKDLGFPVLKAVATFSLNSGAILDAEIGNLYDHEMSLLRRMYDGLSKGDILLGDRGFCGWQNMVELKELGVDSVMRLHAMRKIVSTKQAEKRLGPGDLLIKQRRPFWQAKTGIAKSEWNAFPDELMLRQVTFKVEAPGCRTQVVHLVTTLLDADEYPKEKLMEMYLRRWRIEVVFKDIKCSMGWELLRCKSPEMVRREFLMMLIGYNAIRFLQQNASIAEEVPLERISFKSALQVVRIWEKRFRNPTEPLGWLRETVLCQIAGVQVPERPNRAEPRARKRRFKKTRLMTEPRMKLRAKLLRNQAA
ncbi:IS4 family transposase [Kiritimatiellaeota bacterium B1221]|nr:IS4 family transposase [Kiritimatiellaeota bacterium B1221]